MRQIHTKSDYSNSWFTHIINLLEHYDLPTIKTLLHIVPCKMTWKREVKLAVDKLWNLALIPPRRTSFMLFWTAVQILWTFPIDKIAVSQKAKDDKMRTHFTFSLNVMLSMPIARNPWRNWKLLLVTLMNPSGEFCQMTLIYWLM
jgi:hypothetical protein